MLDVSDVAPKKMHVRTRLGILLMVIWDSSPSYYLHRFIDIDEVANFEGILIIEIIDGIVWELQDWDEGVGHMYQRGVASQVDIRLPRFCSCHLNLIVDL